MNNPKLVGVVQILLLSPAVLFMGSLVVRSLQPVEYEPARTAQWIVMLYAGKTWTLWVLLIALPLAVLAMGCITFVRAWSQDARLAQAAQQTLAAIRTYASMLLIAVTTLTAGVILAIVGLHMLSD